VKTVISLVLVLSCLTAGAAEPFITSLIYHRVDPHRTADSMNTPPARLEEHMNALRHAGIGTLTASEVTAIVSGGRRWPSAPQVAITFDDGFDSTAPEMFRQKGFAATWFITTSLIGRPGYFSLQRLKDLSENPMFEFGAHSVSHFVDWDGKTGTISDARQQAELVESTRILSVWLTRRIYQYAWPYGESNPGLWAIAASNGIVSTWGADASTVENSPGADVRHLRRLNVSGKCTGAQVVEMVRTGKFNAC
jgi:peptidoglycan/xylan/chitin deacetylase (PgdA/CDA1 family)